MKRLRHYTLIADPGNWLMARRNEDDGMRFFVLVDDGQITGIVPANILNGRDWCDLSDEIKV